MTRSYEIRELGQFVPELNELDCMSCFARRLHSPGVVLSDFGWSNKITPAVEGGGAPLLRSL